MHRKLLLFSGLSGTLAVGLGAMGAHLLGPRMGPANLQVYETAARYQMFHTLAMFLTALLLVQFPSRLAEKAGWFFLTGIVLFSGSLYFLALRPLMGIAEDQMKWIGAVTPLGGLAFISGWICIFLFALKLKK